MPHGRHYDLDELTVRPGSYFNPQTEVLIVVDDSPEMDQEIFDMEEFEGADWVLISDDSPIDEHRRDELLEQFQVAHHPGARTADPDSDEDELDQLEPDQPEPDEHEPGAHGI